jgi:DNA-directed RNA polymerase specialized sigma24 family protein
MEDDECTRVTRAVLHWSDYAQRRAARRVRQLDVGNVVIDDLAQDARVRLALVASTQGELPDAHARQLIDSAIADALRTARRRFGPTSPGRRSLDRADFALADDAANDRDLFAITRIRAWSRALPPSLARVYRSLYVEGLSHREAARTLGVTHQRVAALNVELIARARRELALRAA